MDIPRKVIRPAIKLYDGCSECVAEMESLLPDYYPQVTKVIRVTAAAAVTGSSIENGRLTVEGTVRFYLLYRAQDKTGLCGYTCTSEFRQSFETGEDCEGCVRAYARTEYAGCRLQTGRKANFKAVLGIYASVTGTRQLSLPSSFGDDVIVKRNKYDICELVGSASKLFKLSEEGDIAAGASPVGAVLRSEAAVRYKEHKKINNKVICKGDLLVSSLYVRENDEIEQAHFEFPFSQIVDIEGIMEDSDCDVRFTVCDIMAVLSDSMDGSKNIIEYDITMSASAIATKNRQVELITDAFHVGYETLSKSTQIKLEKTTEIIRGETTVKQQVSVPAQATQLLDIAITARTDMTSAQLKTVKVSGSLDIKLLYKTEQGEIESVERNAPYETEYPCALGDTAECTAAVSVLSATGELSGGEQAQLKVQLGAETAVSICKTVSVLSDLEVLHDKPKETSARPVVTVYFANKGEAVWDIAKQYSVSPERIMGLNGIEGEELAQSKRLLLPRRL